MIIARCLLLLILCFSGTSVVLGQRCPTIAELVDQLGQDNVDEQTLVSKVRSNCPSAEDSLSQAFHKISVAAYVAKPKDYDRAIQFALKALKEQRVLAGDTVNLPLGKTLANLGVFYEAKGKLKQAIPYLTEADAVFTALENRKRRIRNRFIQIRVWRRLGDVARANETLEATLREARAAADTKTEARLLWMRGQQYIEIGKEEEALPDLTDAFELYTNDNNAYWIMLGGLELGRVHYHLKQYDKAVKYFMPALAVAEENGYEYNMAAILNNLSLVAVRQSKFDLAESRALEAQYHAKRSGYIYTEATVQNTFAEIALQQGDTLAALVASRKGITLLTPGWTYSQERMVPGTNTLERSPYKLDLFYLLTDHVKYAERAGLPQEVTAAINAADQLTDFLRTEFSGEASKLFWREEALPLYEKGLRLAAAENDVERAYYYYEKSRSILLLENLLEGEVRDQLDDDLAGQLSSFEKQVADLQTKDSLTTTEQSSLIRFCDSLDALRTTLALRYPRAADLLVRPQLADIISSRQQLAAGGWDRQIHYFLGEEANYAFSLTATEATLTPLASPDTLAPALRALLTYYTTPQAIDQDPKGYLAAAHRVYELTIGRLGVPAGERLLIVPDGLLAYVPFSALVTEADVTDLASAPYLLRRNPVSYAQSATVLARQAKATDGDGNYVAFSPFTGASPQENVASLPYSQYETEGLQATLGLTNWLDATAADRTALLEAAPTASLLHLSTHAYATPDETSRPRVLTYTDPIYLPDIYNLTLNADLVTLSACQSNIGPLAQGEGVLGLGRAFAAAGAKGVVASLWSLNDRATADIVTDFYAALAEGTSKPNALHKAQLTYLERTDIPGYLKSPYYWAGLTYYGNAGSLKTKSGSWLWWIGGVLVVLVLLLGGRAKLRKTRPPSGLDPT